MTIGRLSLILILVLQIGIFASFHISEKQETTESEKLLSTVPEEHTHLTQSPSSQPDPFGFEEFEAINKHMNRMFKQAMNEFEYMQTLIDVDDIWHAMPATPAMDMRETENNYTIAFSLPEISPSDIIVTLNGRELTILSPSHLAELNTHILLPGPVKESDYAKSVFTNGILTVNVPKYKKNRENNNETIGL